MIEVLKYVLPALVVVLGIWFLQRSMLLTEDKRRQWDLRRQSQKEITPIRLRAYERLALLLERTEPEVMLQEIMRNSAGQMAQWTVIDLQRELLQRVRLEFEHNLSQQVYVSDEVWQQIVHARDEMGAFITTMAARLPQGATAMDYSKVLIEAYHSNGDTPHQIALDALKHETRTLL